MHPYVANLEWVMEQLWLITSSKQSRLSRRNMELRKYSFLEIGTLWMWAIPFAPWIWECFHHISADNFVYHLTCISDHRALRGTHHIRGNHPRATYYRKQSRISTNRVNYTLDISEFCFLEQLTDVSVAVTEFTNVLKTMFQEECPEKRATAKENDPSFNTPLIKVFFQGENLNVQGRPNRQVHASR